MDAEKEKTAFCLTTATDNTTFDRYSGVQVGKSNIRQTELGSGNQMPAENVNYSNKIRLSVQGREARQDYDLLRSRVFSLTWSCFLVYG